jgi:hypothetical protein
VCPGSFVVSTAPIVYDKTLIGFFTCANGDVIARRWFNVRDGRGTGDVPIPVFVVPDPNQAAQCLTTKPGVDWICKDGGWLPPDFR